MYSLLNIIDDILCDRRGVMSRSLLKIIDKLCRCVRKIAYCTYHGKRNVVYQADVCDRGALHFGAFSREFFSQMSFHIVVIDKTVAGNDNTGTVFRAECFTGSLGKRNKRFICSKQS